MRVMFENSTVCHAIYVVVICLCGICASLGCGCCGFLASQMILAILASLFVLLGNDSFYGEFDPGSGRTLAACLTHASRAERPFGVLERRTGE